MPTLPYIFISSMDTSYHITQWLRDIFFHDCAMIREQLATWTEKMLWVHVTAGCCDSSAKKTVFITFFFLSTAGVQRTCIHLSQSIAVTLQREQPSGVDTCLFQDSNTPGSRPPGDGTAQPAGITGRHRCKDRQRALFTAAPGLHMVAPSFIPNVHTKPDTNDVHIFRIQPPLCVGTFGSPMLNTNAKREHVEKPHAHQWGRSRRPASKLT